MFCMHIMHFIAPSFLYYCRKERDNLSINSVYDLIVKFENALWKVTVFHHKQHLLAYKISIKQNSVVCIIKIKFMLLYEY
jgi:hypothetical protein